MNHATHDKIKSTHLQRNAYLYIRQSTLRQVFENTESTKRQYGLRERALALGWSAEQIIVVDGDQGHSGVSSADREGFQKLVAEVGMGRAGIVMGLEVSRLARNNADWHRLLEICALMETLILDEDGVYDPGHFNDRLLLGLKGTMSEAEIYVLRARLRGGVLNKARRGELKLPLPAGFIYTIDDRVILDPDQMVQRSIRLLFETFRSTGSACAVVATFRHQGLLFPRTVHEGPHRGEMVWGALYHSRVLRTLHNPRYAGAFCYGQAHSRKGANGRLKTEKVARENWITLKPEAHEGYIPWDEFEENQRRLEKNAQGHLRENRGSPPREGSALLQGLVLCGKCGKQMTIRYNDVKAGEVPYYLCQNRGIQYGEPRCQSIHGAGIDAAVGQLLVQAMTPMALEVSLSVQQELQSRVDDADRLRSQRVERARYEAELARRRYMQVDPDNRLVADALEGQWNQALRAVSEAQDIYERQREADSLVLNEQKRKEILALATDFPQLWKDPKTPQRERKRMIRLLVEDVTLKKDENITVHIRFKGGASQTLSVAIPPFSWQKRQTKEETIHEIERLLETHTEGEIASILVERGIRTAADKPFTTTAVARIRHRYDLKKHSQHLQEEGVLTLNEMARLLAVSPATVRRWAKCDLVRSIPVSGRAQMYAHPGDLVPVKHFGLKLHDPRRIQTLNTDSAQEV